MLNAIDRFVVRMGQGIMAHRWLTVILSILLVGWFAYGARYLGFSTDYRVYFGPENPQLKAFDQVQNVYNKNDITMVVIEPPGDTTFNRETLSLVDTFTERAWGLPYVIRIDSVTNFQHTEAEGDDLKVADLVDNPAGLTDAELAAIRAVAINEPLLAGRLSSRDGRVLAVAVTHQYLGKSSMEVTEAVAATRQLRDELLAEYPEHRIYLSGSNMMSNTFAEASMADIQSLYPLMYGLLIVVVYLFLRSVTATAATVVIIVFSTVGAMGLAGYLGISLTSPSAISPIVITTLAVADSVHILVSLFALMREGKSKQEAMVESLRLNFMPVFLTSITTALGLLSINFADSPPLHDLGNISAMGSILAWLLSITLLPALIAIFPVKVPARKGSFMAARMMALGEWTVRNKRPVFWSSALISAALMAMIPLNEANDKFVHYFDERIQFRNDSDFMADNITGLYTMEFSLPAKNGVADPAYLAQLDAFKNWWYENPKVMHVSSVSDIFKRLNKNLHGDDPEWYRLPTERDMAAQYLLLYEFSLPFGLDLNNSINLDKTASRFIVTFEHLKSRETRETLFSGQQWLRDNAPDLAATGVSPAVMFAFIAERNFSSMAVGIPLALLGISVILVLALRSLKFGLVSLVPNLFPMGMAFGLWAIYNGEVNFTMSFSMGVMLGIIVDDTIHFMSKYLRARREQNISPEEAVVHTFRTVGPALLVTSLTLALGFLVLCYSAFYPTASMSLLTVMGIACALITDFLLLPVVLLWADREKASEQTMETACESSAS
ncbi:hypothetical protein FHR99_000301 [Litorivivens lipolytica]|uniref:SSD domain-containing protein n=1 Tax=Litorivivens lipolytica TaxID=1524264 RepID=A0A7W4W2E8_9GAMM|nr:MMPL family transporter [Litorivivens lipolytica]MBB3046065.1 hypothetical protein [Litorivivens lipolytica]